MKKLKLDLDALEVDTFDPAPPEDAEGTVFGEQIGITGWLSCVAATCVTCHLSCRPTCGPTCLLTCGHVTCGATCQRTCQFSCGFTCVSCHISCIPQGCGPVSGAAICP